jgi:large subunit ribosomal protein L4
MNVSLLSVEAARAAGIPVVEGGKFSQALHEAVVGYRAARRSGTASTKTKAEVNLSGSKPWRQKGTGRARAGYKSSPVWVGGGVVFGPKPRDYRKTLTRSVKRVALLKALSMRIIEGAVSTVPAIAHATPRTKEFISSLGDAYIKGSILVVSPEFSQNTFLAARNLQNVQLLRSSDVNAEDLVRFKTVIFSGDALSELSKRVNS